MGKSRTVRRRGFGLRHSYEKSQPKRTAQHLGDDVGSRFPEPSAVPSAAAGPAVVGAEARFIVAVDRSGEAARASDLEKQNVCTRGGDHLPDKRDEIVPFSEGNMRLLRNCIYEVSRIVYRCKTFILRSTYVDVPFQTGPVAGTRRKKFVPSFSPRIPLHLRYWVRIQ